MRRVLQFLPVLNSVHLSGNFPNGCVTAVVVQRSDHQAGPRASASYRVQSRRRAGIWLAQTSNTPGARSTVSTRSSGQPRMRTVFVERPISMCRCDHRPAARATRQALSLICRYLTHAPISTVLNMIVQPFQSKHDNRRSLPMTLRWLPAGSAAGTRLPVPASSTVIAALAVLCGGFPLSSQSGGRALAT